MKKTLIILAPGFEEIEALTPIDILRRAKIEVTIASLEEDRFVRGRNDISVQADVALSNLKNSDFDCIIIPGGPGAKKLRKSDATLRLVKELFEKNRLIAAICAGPTILLDAGILKDKKYTAHFSHKDELPDIRPEKVVIDDNIITSQGPGTAIVFALAIVEVLEGKQVVEEIKKSICFP